MLTSLRSVLTDKLFSLAIATEIRGCRIWNASRSPGLRVHLLSKGMRALARLLRRASDRVRPTPFDDVPF